MLPVTVLVWDNDDAFNIGEITDMAYGYVTTLYC